jgi:hypothetical protein
MVRSEPTSPCKGGLEENFLPFLFIKKRQKIEELRKEYIQSPHIANNTLSGS